jgi:hypothetical protein
MAYVIVATRLGFGSEPLSLECDVRCWGPFRDDETAHRRLTTYKRAVDRAGLSDDWQLGLEYVFPGSEPARQVVEDLHNVGQQARKAYEAARSG